MIQSHFTCRCGKKVKRITKQQFLCKDCRVEVNLQKRGKSYREQLKKETAEYDAT